jgi:hypothetical protein
MKLTQLNQDKMLLVLGSLLLLAGLYAGNVTIISEVGNQQAILTSLICHLISIAIFYRYYVKVRGSFFRIILLCLVAINAVDYLLVMPRLVFMITKMSKL